MGSCKALTTFKTVEDMEEVWVSGATSQWKIFEDVRKWTPQNVCQTQRTRVECIGIPLHAWSQANLKKIGELWGSVISFDNMTTQRSSFSRARILMETC